MSNIVCIDPSLSCTAVVVNDKKAAFVKQDLAFTKTMRMVKWFEAVDKYADFFYHTFNDKKLSFAELERSKLRDYDKITDSVIDYIKLNLADGPTKVFIEGYSFSSAAGPLIDLVTFGTLLRKKLFSQVSQDITVIAPTELKLYSAKLTYPMVLEKKKEVWRNREGVSGGSFKKHDMYKAMIENDGLTCEWVNMLREHASDIMAQKAVPKPIEDLNDAKLMYEVAKANKYL